MVNHMKVGYPLPRTFERVSAFKLGAEVGYLHMHVEKSWG